ncbi:hypothetical protein [Nonlabens xiamenensis]|uniref:hypothetical protein n=1 Tax=Nonlabens xiamenensis TaxID=2341043 RepID=UPI000F611934|nr:hypothetical protein [Nonlabens xiamenensis]
MNNKFSLIKSVGCSLTGHRFRTSHVVNDRIQEMCCANCGKEVTTNIFGQTVPLSDSYHQINRALNDVARKRRRAGVQLYS